MDETKNNYKNTLNLPRTDFPIRSNPKVDDPAMIERWEQEDLATATFTVNEGKEKFILMDGPPYANGPIHLGHAYNKTLKDIVAKSQRMQNKHVPVVPGWDCHGLPIELKVTQANPGLSRAELKKACRAYANEWIAAQMKDFKRLGVQNDWKRPYTTMDFAYEADTLRAFGVMVEKGYIERKNKSVPWCYSCQTVLATAEIEYQERKDPSIYVLFALTSDSVQKLLPDLAGQTVSVCIWTTTPWTLPLNRSVVLKPDTTYVVLDINQKLVIVAHVLADKLCATMGVEKKCVATFATNAFSSKELFVYNPLLHNKVVPILLDGSVLLEDGTACVHNAPGAGPEDYEVGVKNGLEIFSPVAADGTMTSEIEIPELVGMSVDDAQIWVFKKLAEVGALLHKTSLRHSYPHCWRCHKGLIFRATKQWFCNLLHDNLKNKAIALIDGIHMLPEASHNRFKATIENRLEWCFSRQRVWGVPITALLCVGCDWAHIDASLIKKVADAVEQEGIEFWDTVSVADVMPSGLICKRCHGTTFKKEQDILDVWFESGVSHYAVLQKNPALAFPADMYLEGKDQHRAYFQSSLLTSVAINNAPCMKTIVTHGFTVDQTGRKMSKSIGNVVSPQEIIDEIGTDCLRLWAASIDCSGEAVVSEKLLSNVQEVFRKVRNTCRFLLSNLYDFDMHKDAIPVDQLRVVDAYALAQLAAFNQKIIRLYNEYNFTAIFHALGDYCSVDLSAFYLDIIKDRLYVEKADGNLRRSAQTVCFYILDALTKAMAPILSFTAEQLSDQYQKGKAKSIHLQAFADFSAIQNNMRKRDQIEVLCNEQIWKLIKDVRSALLKAIELQREKQMIKHPLEARLVIYFDTTHAEQKKLADFFGQLVTVGQTVESFFKELLVVSQVVLQNNAHELAELQVAGLFVRVDTAKGTKCPRCWQWIEAKHADTVCDRCAAIV